MNVAPDSLYLWGHMCLDSLNIFGTCDKERLQTYLGMLLVFTTDAVRRWESWHRGKFKKKTSCKKVHLVFIYLHTLFLGFLHISRLSCAWRKLFVSIGICQSVLPHMVTRTSSWPFIISQFNPQLNYFKFSLQTDVTFFWPVWPIKERRWSQNQEIIKESWLELHFMTTKKRVQAMTSLSVINSVTW